MGKVSAADVFNHVYQYVPVCLTNADCRDRITAVAAAHPPLSGAILEVFLGAQSPRIDWSQRYLATDGERNHLGGAAGALWATGATTAWLEYDLPAGGMPHPQPAIFFGADGRSRTTCEEREVLTTRGLSVLGHPTTTSELSVVRNYLFHLPANARVNFTGLLAGRRPVEKRLCLTGFQTEQLLPYLTAVGWRGNGDVFSATTARFCPLAERIMLNLPIAERVGPEISFELGQRHEDNWAGLLGLLPTAGLAGAREVEEILNWSGYQDISEPSLRRNLGKIIGQEASWWIRRISHVKFTVGVAGEVSVKVYLFYGYA